MPEPLDDHLCDPVRLGEIMLLTQVMISINNDAQPNDSQPLGQEQIDNMLDVQHPADDPTNPCESRDEQ